MCKFLPMALAVALTLALSGSLIIDHDPSVAPAPAATGGATAVIGTGTLAEPGPASTMILPAARCWVKTLPVDECPPDPRPPRG